MSLIEIIQDCIDKWDLVGLNSEINKEENVKWIEKNAWDLVPVLLFPATEENLSKCPHIVHACSKILQDPISKIGNPKELIIALLEQCEHSGSTIKLQHCLPALENCLLRLDLKASVAIWDWALRTIIEHIINMDMPEIQELEGKERLALEHDEKYSNLIYFVNEIANLLDSLAKKIISFESEDKDRIVKLKGCVLWSCIQILARPLAYLNISMGKSDFLTSAMKVCSKLNMIVSGFCSNFVHLVNLKDFCLNFSNNKAWAEDDVEERKKQLYYWSFGIGTLFYYNFQSGQFPFPMCYDPLYIFQVVLHIILNMLDFVKGLKPLPYFRHEKALMLCQALSSRISKNTVPDDIFEDEDHTKLVEKLHQIIIFHDMECVRKLAYETYNQYFLVFSEKSKTFSMMLNFVLRTANHSGLIGHAIGILKNKLIKNLKENNQPEEFSDSNLQILIKRFCQLSNGTETDLLEVSDEIMASLNFLICMLIRDKENVLKIWNIIEDLENNFLKPLDKGLSMSRAHYKLKLDESKNQSKNSAKSDVTLMVGGQPLPDMSKEQMNSVIQSALNTFDMMECVLCQLNDVISQNKHKH